MFSDIGQEERKEKLEKTIDNLRLRYGYDVIKNGVMLEDKKLTYIPPDYNRSSYRIGSILGT